MRLLVAAWLLLAALVAAGCTGGGGGGGSTTSTGTTATTVTTPPPVPLPTLPGNGTVWPMLPGTYTATIETSMGTIHADLYADKAPLSVATFLQYAQDGGFDGTVFHRVVKGFVIQGGGFSAPLEAKSTPRPSTMGPVPIEIWKGSAHLAGTLGMARTQDPNSGSHQWFIDTKDNPSLDSGYTVFGKVTSGMDVVHAIENVSVGTKGTFQSVPQEDVVIKKVTVQAPNAPGAPNLALVHASYHVVPGRNVSIPVLVKNVGGGTLHATLQLGDAPTNVTVSFDRGVPPLAPGQAWIAIATLATPADFGGGNVTLQAEDNGHRDAASVRLDAMQAEGNASGPDHPLVQAYYVGTYDNGVVFDTTATGLGARGFALPAGFGEHVDAFKAYVGNETASTNSTYVAVIPGFASGIVGLQKGETRTVRLTSEEGYKDGYDRVFEMTVASVDD